MGALCPGSTWAEPLYRHNRGDDSSQSGGEHQAMAGPDEPEVESIVLSDHVPYVTPED
jgi:hypothetical protein